MRAPRGLNPFICQIEAVTPQLGTLETPKTDEIKIYTQDELYAADVLANNLVAVPRGGEPGNALLITGS